MAPHVPEIITVYYLKFFQSTKPSLNISRSRRLELSNSENAPHVPEIISLLKLKLFQSKKLSLNITRYQCVPRMLELVNFENGTISAPGFTLSSF